MKKLISFVLIYIFALSFATAHRGKTDAQGGHYDYENESGLGSYHYHHGYSAHLHENGVCPYEITTTAPTEPTEPEPTQPQTEQATTEQTTETTEDIDYSQFESLEEAYQAGYYYALYNDYSNLYEENENRSKLESLLNLGIATNLYFNNSEVIYEQPTSEGFTNEDAFQEGLSEGIRDLENTLSEYENSDFYTNNEIYKAGAEEFDTSEIEKAAYQDGYQKGLNDFTEIEPSNNKSDELTIIDLSLYLIAFGFIIYSLHQFSFKLCEKYPSSNIALILFSICGFVYIFTLLPYLIGSLVKVFAEWSDERKRNNEIERLNRLKNNFEKYKKGEYLPQIWELEEFKKNGWSE